jgi:peptide/nickel transport system substrate-binding protein
VSRDERRQTYAGALATPSIDDEAWTRRRLATVVLPVAMIAAACSNDESAGPSSDAAPAGTPDAPAARRPQGELKIASFVFPATFDPTRNTEGGAAVRFGVGETLTRLTPDLKIEPWLAESVTLIDPTTWRVVLRANARFHDGSPVTADDVARSFQRIWESQPAAAGFIPKETRLAVLDARTLTFTTPTPLGGFRNTLSRPTFIVFKQTPAGSLLTGPYRPGQITSEDQVTLTAFAEHWAGPPPIAAINVRHVIPAQTRLLALQAGDVDLVNSLIPDQLQGLPSGIEPSVTPSMRVSFVQFNHRRRIFADQAAREAFALGIDRSGINTAVLDGQGTPASTLFPSNLGVEVVPAQGTDGARARQVLDAAGWRVGADDVRVKDGVRLAFTLFSAGGTGAPTAQAQVIQAQLKPLGFDVQVQERQDLFSAILPADEWDAAMTSFATLPTGDPLYLYTVTLLTGGDFNYGKYSNAHVDRIIEQMRGELDEARRQALSLQVQESFKADVPYACLVAQPRVEAFRKAKLKNYTPHPNDLYFIDSQMSVV